MARVTVEDCVEKVDNRFELVLLAGQRARAVAAGAPLTIDRDNDKNPVVALREIAEETVSVVDLKEDAIQGLQHYVEVDEPEDDELDAFEAEGLLAAEGAVAVPEAEVAADALTVQEDATVIEANAELEAAAAVDGSTEAQG